MKQLPYGVQTENKFVHRAVVWCEEQFGPRWEAIGNRAGTWCVFWSGRRTVEGCYQWWFETEQQKILFALRWL